MIPDRDYFLDKEGKVTTDASRAAIQLGVKGCFLDPRIANRYGLTDMLVSVDEPAAPRRITPAAESSIKISKPAEESEEQPQEPAAAEVKKKPAAKKGEKRK